MTDIIQRLDAIIAELKQLNLRGIADTVDDARCDIVLLRLKVEEQSQALHKATEWRSDEGTKC